MLGVYDFCGHYEWTFNWLNEQGGHDLVLAYWDEAIHQDSQQHAVRLILEKGFAGMREYWGEVLEEEAAGYAVTETERVFRIDMHACPSKGFLLANGLQQYPDYCNHCLGWIGPLLRRAGYVVDHQHDHQGKCWWEIRPKDDLTPASAPGTLAGDRDVRLDPGWAEDPDTVDSFRRSNHPDDKMSD